jgi:hypothetical protein
MMIETEQSMTDPETTSRTLAGTCLCGAPVAYLVADEFLYAANCHCSQCRQATGAAFKPFAGIERDKLRLTKGGDNLLNSMLMSVTGAIV